MCYRGSFNSNNYYFATLAAVTEVCALPSVVLVSVGVQEGDAEGAVVVDANP